MGFLTNYNQLTKELKSEYDTAYSNYCSNLKKTNEEVEKACNKYNAQIGVINSLRHELRVELSLLYKFLKKFGDVGKKITPFQYVTEDLQSAGKEDARILEETEEEEDKSNLTRIVQGVAIVVNPVAIPAVFIGEAWSKLNQSKKIIKILLKHMRTKK